MTIYLDVPYPRPIVWLVLESNIFCFISLGHSTVISKCRLHLWGQSEAFPTSTTSSWIFTIRCTTGPAHYIGFYLLLFLFRPFIVLVGWMVHVHSIKFYLHIVLGTPIPILDVSGNLILWFIDQSWINTVKSLNITFIGVRFFSFGVDLGSIIYFSLNCYKSRIFF